MTSADISLEVRLAHPSDYKKVERLCRRAAGPHDYVLWILREVIKDKGLYLAWAGDQLVAMTNFDICIDGSGWLSMARTDPDWQGRGVAGFLQSELAERARKGGARRLRLWTLSTNTAALRACKKGGFRPVCEAVHVSHGFRSGKDRGYSRLTRDGVSARKILKSAILSKMRGYIAYKWHFVKANHALLRKMRRAIHSVGGSTFLLTEPEVSFRRLSSSFALLVGDPTESMQLILSKARSLRVDWVGGYVPYDRHPLHVVSRTGFKVDSWGNHCLVFEKAI